MTKKKPGKNEDHAMDEQTLDGQALDGHPTDGQGAENVAPSAESSETASSVPGGDAAGASGDEGAARIRRLEESVLRAKADYQNLLRRNQLERTEAVRFANADLMRSLLGVLDDMERSLESATGDDEALTEGVRLVYGNFRKALADHGLTPIEAEGKPFDPQVHEALMRQPSADHEPGTVISEIARGYSLYDRVVRPARVIVACEAADGAHASAAQGENEDGN